MMADPEELRQEILSLRSSIDALLKDKLRLSASEQQLQKEKMMLQAEQKQLQVTCQALARQLEEADNQKQGNDASTVAALSTEMAQLKLKAADQERLQETLQRLQLENAHLRHACSQQAAVIGERDRQLNAQASTANFRNGAINHSEVDVILNQAQQEMAAERQNYERALADLHTQLKKKDEDIGNYQAQLKLFMSDFAQEHTEKETAKKQLSELQNELSLTKELLSQYNSQAMASAHQRRQEAMQKIRQQYYSQHPEEAHGSVAFNQPLYRNRGRGLVVCDGDEERPLAEDEDIIDSLIEPEEPGTSAASSNDLQCPKCQRRFPVDQHSDFLEHIDTC